MKNYVFLSAILATAAAVAIPQAPVVTYGFVRDEYGNPLADAAALSLRLVREGAPDGRVYARTAVGATAYPGMNYRLSLEIDSEGPTRPYAVLKGTDMRIRFLIDGADQDATPTPVFTTPANGTAQRLDFSLGTDADGDGLPDAWEKWVLELDGRASDAAAVAAFLPGADADGDGMSNLREFLAGTDPFIDTDLFEIVSYVRDAAVGKTAIAFTTVPGRTYRLVTTASLAEPVWVPVAAARTADAAPTYGTYAGTGRTITLYVDTPETSAAFFRVAAQ